MLDNNQQSGDRDRSPAQESGQRPAPTPAPLDHQGLPQPGLQPVPGLLGALPPLRRHRADADPLGGTAVDGSIAEALRRRQGSGGRLPDSVADPMGQQLGIDTSALRVHADPEAGSIARSVQADAFTYGNDIYFAPGRYQPSSGAGQHVLAHELSHVAAQRAGSDGGSAGPLTVGRANDPAETAADRSADRVVSALRRSLNPEPAATASDWSSAIDPTGIQIRRWPWGKKDKKDEQSEATAERPTKKAFADAVTKDAPTSPAEARTRMESLRTLLGTMSTDERAKVATDKKLMKLGRTYVGDNEYFSLLAAVGTYNLPGKKARKSGGAPVHMDGREADGFIRKNMGAIGHLKPFIDTAVDAGKQAEGYVAVLDSKQWDSVYETQFDDEKVGSDDELTTNAYIANENVDRPAMIHQDRGTRSTAIHESMHRYSDLAVLNTYGFRLNEGITEYFTRLITDKDGNPVAGKPSNRDNYESNWEFVCAMLTMLGTNAVAQQTTLAEIYFAGKTELFKTNFESGCKAGGLDDLATADRWTDFVAAVKGGKWSDAVAEFPPPPAKVPTPKKKSKKKSTKKSANTPTTDDEKVPV